MKPGVRWDCPGTGVEGEMKWPVDSKQEDSREATREQLLN